MVKKKQGRFVRTFNKKLKTNGLFIFLGLISMTGFALQTFTLLTGKNLTGTFAWASVLLGAGLIFESQIKQFFQNLFGGRVKKVTPRIVTKLVTAIVGSVILVGGLATIPFLGVTLGPVLKFVLAGANGIAILIIFIEVFIID